MSNYDQDPQNLDKAIAAVPYGAPPQEMKNLGEVSIYKHMHTITTRYSPGIQEQLSDSTHSLIKATFNSGLLRLEDDGSHVRMTVVQLRGLMNLAAASGAIQAFGTVGNALNSIQNLESQMRLELPDDDIPPQINDAAA